MLKSYLILEGVSCVYAVNKLKREGISLYSVKKYGKTGILILIARKDVKKVFAILQSSCYNVKKVFPTGITRALRFCKRRVGLFVGAFLFFSAISFAQTYVLRIDVVGSGAYYVEEVRAVLRRHGISSFGKFPPSTALAKSEILSLKDVTFCEISHAGGIVTVEVQADENADLLKSEPLVAPTGGRVERLVVMRGVPLVTEGQTVEAGQILVDCQIEGRETVVIAQAEIYTEIAKEYQAETEEGALSMAQLEYGEQADLRAERSPSGWTVVGTVVTVARMNMK